MGEAKRRRRSIDHPSFESISAAIHEMHVEGQGVWKLTLITPIVGLALAAQALAGDTFAARMMRAVNDFIRTLSSIRPGILCLFCDHEFTTQSMPAVIVLTHAARDDAVNAICQGICDECEEKGDLPNRLISRYRELITPDARLIEIGSPGHT